MCTSHFEPMRTKLKPTRNLRRLLKLFGLSAVCVFLFSIHISLLWNYSEIVLKTRIEDGFSSPIFHVVAMVEEKAELFLSKEDLDNYLKTHENYSFLIPVGQEASIQQQVERSYNERFRGKSFPVVKAERVDANRQNIKIHMHGDPTSNVFWYEASEKEIKPKYYMFVSVVHALVFVVLAVGMVVVEYRIGLLMIRKLRAQLPTNR